MIVELGLDLVVGAALSVGVLFRRIFRIRIAALNHEILDDPMENRAVIEALARQLLEVSDGVWRSVSPKLNDHIAFAGFYDCNFVGGAHGRLLFLFFG